MDPPEGVRRKLEPFISFYLIFTLNWVLFVRGDKKSSYISFDIDYFYIFCLNSNNLVPKMTISLIYIKRESQKEDTYLNLILNEIQRCKKYFTVFPEIIIVGRTQLDLERFDLDIKFIRTLEKWDIDGLICHKKNTGVRKSSKEICIVMHCDVFIPEKTLISLFGSDDTLRNQLHKKTVNNNMVLAPIAYYCPQNNQRTSSNLFSDAIVDTSTMTGTRSFTWSDLRRGDRWKSETEPYDPNTYISGGVIMGSKSVFSMFPWNEELRHNMEEDWELSKRMHKGGVNLECEPLITLLMFEIQ
jgi:hypothetical protein